MTTAITEMHIPLSQSRDVDLHCSAHSAVSSAAGSSWADRNSVLEHLREGNGLGDGVLLFGGGGGVH